MSKGLLYINSSNQTTIEEGSNLPLGDTTYRFGRCLKQEGYNILLCEQGYYSIIATFSVVPDAVSTVTISAYANGKEIVNVESSASMATDTPTALNITIPFAYKVKCCNEPTRVSFVLSGASVEVLSSSIQCFRL